MKPIRVAFSGAGFRIPGHVGALKAILEAGYEIVEIAGTSAGSIIAALYASGMPIEEMENLCMTQDWGFLLTCDPWSGWRNLGYCSGNALHDWMHQQTGGKTFSDIRMQLKIVSADLVTEQEYIFNKSTTPIQTLSQAVRCSASIPFVYAPVSMGGMLLVDGGIADNIPADLLTIDNVPRLGIYLVTNDSPLAPGSHGLITVASRIIDLMLASNEAAHMGDATLTGAKIVRVPTGFATTLDTNMPTDIRQRLVDAGYQATKAKL